MSDQPTSTDRRFARLAAGAALVTLLMIVIGAVTRVTESGYGCGPYWPSCNGHIIPEFHDMTVVIEYGHRLFALIVGGFTVATGLMAWRHYRAEPRLFTPTMLAVILFFVQSGLGAITVALYQYAPNVQWVSVLIHLGNSMFLLAAFLVVWVNARYTLGVAEHDLRAQAQIALPPAQLALAAALSFLVAMVGAAVAGTNATRACVGWPLCGGEIWPAQQGPLQALHMLHRLVAGALGLMLILMLLQARKGNPSLRSALAVALAFYLAQAALGALIVLVDDRDWLVVSRSLHVLFAALTWAAIIVAGTTAWLQLLPNVVRRLQMGSASSPTRQAAAPSATTSN